MVNWEDALKKYVASKLSKNLGYIVNPDDIKSLDVNVDNIDLNDVEIGDLGVIGVFAIMREDFERVTAVVNELKTRNHEFKIESDEKNKTAEVIIYNINEPNVIVNKFYMKILPDGMLMDFEKQLF